MLLTSKLPHRCNTLTKPMKTQTIQDRYNQQVRNDRKVAALQRKLDRESGGYADVDLVNLLYQN